MPGPKFVLSTSTATLYGTLLYRVSAIQAFSDVVANTLGGYVEKEANLSQTGNCWVYPGAAIYGNALVSDNAQIRDTAKVYGQSRVFENAIVRENGEVFGNARVYGSSQVYGTGKVCEDAHLYGSAQVYGTGYLGFTAHMFGSSVLTFNAGEWRGGSPKPQFPNKQIFRS